MIGESTSLLWDNNPRLLEISRQILDPEQLWLSQYSEEELEVLAPLIWGVEPSEVQKGLIGEQFDFFLQQIDNWLNQEEVEFIQNSWEARTSRIKELIRQRDEARATALAANARQIFPKDNTIALNLVMAAYQLAQTEESVGALHDILSDPASVFYQKNSQFFFEILTLIDFSPDGQQIVTARDHIVKLWDLQGNLIQTFAGHDNVVTQVAFDPEGEYLLTGSHANKAILWRLDGTLVKTLEHANGRGTGSIEAVALAISRVNDLILTVGGKNEINLWNFKGEFIRDFNDHSDLVTSAAFSKDGQYILSGSYDKTARIWHKDTGFVRSFLHDSRVTAVAFSPDGKHILTGTFDNELLLWEIEKPESEVQRFSIHGGTVTTVAFSPDGAYLLSGCRDTIIRLWKPDGTLVHAFTEHTGEIQKVAFTPDGKYCMSSSLDGTVKSWELRRIKNRTIVPRDSPNESINLAFSPDDKHLIAEFWGLGAINSELEDNLKDTYNKDDLTSALAFSNDGGHLIVSIENEAHLWNFEGEFMHTFSGHTRNITCAALSFDGQYVLAAYGYDDYTAKVWKRNGELIATLDNPDCHINFAEFSPDGEKILTADTNLAVKLWNIKGELLHTLPRQKDYFSNGAFSPDGRYFVTSSFQMIRLWDINGNFIWSTQVHGYGHSLAFSSDGKYILVAVAEYNNNGVSLLNINGKIIQTIYIEGSYIRAAAFSSNGRDLLVCDQNWAVLKLPHILGDWNRNLIHQLCVEDQVRYKIDELGPKDNITGRIADNIYRNSLTN